MDRSFGFAHERPQHQSVAHRATHGAGPGSVSRARAQRGSRDSATRLEAYSIARQFLADVAGLLRELPRGESCIADQLKRAADSALLNLCEARLRRGYGGSVRCLDGSAEALGRRRRAGRRAGRDKARFYDIARGSGTECAAILTLLAVRGLAAPESLATARVRLHRLVCMLTALARSARRRGEGDARGA